MTKQSRTILISSIAAVLIGVGGAFWYYQSTGNIKPYDAARDKAFIMKVFKDNWYWLLSDYTPNYDVEFMLDHRAPTAEDMSDAGKLILRTYVIDGTPVGFIHYYEDVLKVGRILFMGVGKDYRGKGYARELVKYVVGDLKKRGMLTIRMYTRTDNTRARKLYDSLGFKQIWTDGAYMIYEIIP